MSLSKKGKVLLSLVGFFVIGGAVYAGTTHSKSVAKVNQVLNLSESSSIMSLDAAKITDGVSSAQLSQVGEGLYRLNSKSQPVNALAETTKVSDGGKVYTINLRHDGKWSNGQKVTAKDFVFAWRRVLNPKTKSEFTYLFSNIKNADQVAEGKQSPKHLGVKAIGNYQLQITLSKPASYFKKILAGTTFYPVNPKAVEKYGTKYGTTANKMVYNGPFTLKKWTGSNDTWTLEKNPTYRDKKIVKLSQIKYQVVKSNTTSYNLYQAHKLDSVVLSGEQNVQNQNNKNLKTLANGRIGFIQYNQKDQLASNQDLRNAISLAINRQQLASKILENGSVPAKSFGVQDMAKNPVTNADFTSDSTVKNTVSYDVNRAQDLYKKAQKQLNKKNMTLTITCGDDDVTHQIAEFIQGQLTSHLPNLKVIIKAMPFTTMLGKVSKGEFQMNLTSWEMDFADPSQSLTILTSKSNSNMGHYQSKDFDQLMLNADGKDALNAKNRYQDLVSAGKIILKDQAVTPLYESRSHILTNSKLKGVVYNKFSGAADYRKAYLQLNG